MKSKIDEYLNKRGVYNKKYLDYIHANSVGKKTFSMCSVDGFDFVVSHLFDDS